MTPCVTDLSQTMAIFKRNRLSRLFKGRPKIGLTISGGGCRAFYGLGFGSILTREGIILDAISATSAGTAMALSLAVGNAEEVTAYFCELTAKNKSNFHLDKLIRGKRPFPHETMYRQTIQENIDLEKLARQKTILRFNSLRFPKNLYPDHEPAKRNRVIFRMIAAYRKEEALYKKGIIRPILTSLAVAEGLQEVVFTNSDFHDAGRVEDIILATSSAPPFVSLQQLDGEFYLDGGVYDNVPIRLLPEVDLVIAVHYRPESRKVVEMLERDKGRRVFWVAPSREIPISMWDYTNPQGVKATFELGKRDGENLLRLLDALL